MCRSNFKILRIYNVGIECLFLDSVNQCFFSSDEDSDIVNKNSDTEDANKENGVCGMVNINIITFILKVKTCTKTCKNIL